MSADRALRTWATLAGTSKSLQYSAEDVDYILKSLDASRGGGAQDATRLQEVKEPTPLSLQVGVESLLALAYDLLELPLGQAPSEACLDLESRDLGLALAERFIRVFDGQSTSGLTAEWTENLGLSVLWEGFS